jgi:hypothetical protein
MRADGSARQYLRPTAVSRYVALICAIGDALV